MFDGFLGELTDPVVHDISLDRMAFRLVLSAVLGAGVAIIYSFTMRRESRAEPSFLATLVLLSILIAMVTQVVGNSVARAFSLVGALSIVRFRTVVEDTRDTAFVIFTVIVGMAVGTGSWQFALVGMCVVGASAAVLRWFPSPLPASAGPAWALQIRVAAAVGDRAPWEAIFAKHAHAWRLDGAATARQGASVDFNFLIQLRSTPQELLNELNRIEGIQTLELKSR